MTDKEFKNKCKQNRQNKHKLLLKPIKKWKDYSEYLESIEWQKIRKKKFEQVGKSCQNDYQYWDGDIMPKEIVEWIDENFVPAEPLRQFKLLEETRPYFGWCDVEGCGNESCSNGVAWSKTGYWKVCHDHSRDFRDGKPQPKMKQAAIKRENSRDKVTGFLPINRGYKVSKER